MSQEKVLNTLQSLGLSASDANVYVFLGKKGPKKVSELVRALKIPKQQLYFILRNLQGKGIINATLERPARFSAQPFEKVLDLFVKLKMEEAQRIQNVKTEILSDWRSITIKESDNAEKFSVLRGKAYIYSKLKQMREEAKEQLQIISTVAGLIRADQSGLLDLPNRSENVIQIRFLTELSEQNVSAIRNLLQQKKNKGLIFEGRVPELGLKLFSRVIIRDGQEAAIFISNDEKNYQPETDTCLWTDCKALVNSFSAVFEELWCNSTDIENKIMEKTGKLSYQTTVFENAEKAKTKYFDSILKAKKEILIITSMENLELYETRIKHIDRLASKNVTIKLLTPITSNNFNSLTRLSDYCEIRHIPPNYVDTTLIDEQQLFQFKSSAIKEGACAFDDDYFKNTFYTNDLDYIEKNRNIIYDIWRRAYSPFIFTPKHSVQSSKAIGDSTIEEKRSTAYGRVFNFIEKPNIPNGITEKTVLDKIFNAKKRSPKNWLKEGITNYGSFAHAFINLPKNFGLPNLMIQIWHDNSQSSFGEGNILVFYALSDFQSVPSYGWVATVCDNRRMVDFLRSFQSEPSKTPIFLFKRNQLEVRIQGNRLFVGWTKPIPLSNYNIMPPSCLLFEGYGDLRPNFSKIDFQKGWHLEHEGNSFEAFTTFIYPSSKISIPGINGLLFRDSIITYVPPTSS